MKPMCSVNLSGLVLISTYRLLNFKSHKYKVKPYSYNLGNVKTAKIMESFARPQPHTHTPTHTLFCHKNIQNIQRHLNKSEALKMCYVHEKSPELFLNSYL